MSTIDRLAEERDAALIAAKRAQSDYEATLRSLTAMISRYENAASDRFRLLDGLNILVQEADEDPASDHLPLIYKRDLQRLIDEAIR